MLRRKINAPLSARLWRRPILFLFLGFFTLLAQQPGKAQPPPPDALSFFKNYFVTGDYRVGQVDLSNSVSGFSEGDIHFNAALGNEVPDEADILGAFLFWEMVTEGTPDLTGSSFRGHDISSIAKQVGPTNILSQETSPCWAGGSGTTYQMRSFRADVLRFLHVPASPAINGGKRIVNDDDYSAAFAADSTVVPIRVRLPEANGNQLPSSAGASLVVIYKDADPAKPLKSIVLYDGSFTQTKDSTTHVIETMNQTIKGFYQLTASPAAKMTQLVGGGANNPTERVWFGSDFNNLQNIDTDSFPGVSSTSDRAWFTETFPLGPVSGGSFATRVDHTGNSPYDCLHWVAIAFSGNAQDRDGDGYLDVWEEQAAVVDPNGQPLPNLYEMGARANRKDLFVEFGYATAAAGTSYGIDPSLQVTVDEAHDHRPTWEALKQVGDAFKLAPVSNPESQPSGIKVHFDLGDDFPTGTAAEEYLIRDTTTLDLARGGESIEETDCVPYDNDGSVSTPLVSCFFAGYPGTWGWKSGFKFLRDEPLSLTVDDPLDMDPPSTTPNPTEQACVAAETDDDDPEVTTCERRFDRNRRDIFRYALWGHALALQRFDDVGAFLIDPPGSLAPGGPLKAPPCETGVLMPPAACTGSFIPRNVSGTADGGGSGGGDMMITLGPFGGHEGNGGPHAEAATFMHELGHTLRLRHGAVLGSNGIATPDVNCKTNYQSVMNYLYQLRGLIIDSGTQAGSPAVNFSGQVLYVPGGAALAPIDENDLKESAGLVGSPMAYRPRWFTPSGVASSLSDPVTRHCDGTRRTPDEILADVSMFTVEGTSTTGPIDWNADGVIDPPAAPGIDPQDINFNGGPNDGLATPTSTDGPFRGFNDWAYIDLRQTGSRRNVASPAGDDLEGPLSLDQGVGDNGVGDNGVGDNGVGDNGVGDNGVGDNGVGDNGVGDNGEPAADIDIETALANGAGAPNALTVTVTGSSRRDALLNWSAPVLAKVFNVAQYEIYRVTGLPVNLANAVRAGTVVGTGGAPPATTFLDPNLRRRTTYTYFVIAASAANAKSARSNLGAVLIP